MSGAPALLLLALAGEPRLGLAELVHRSETRHYTLQGQGHRVRALGRTADQKQDESQWRGWELTLQGNFYPGNGIDGDLVGFDKRTALNLNLPILGSAREREMSYWDARGDFFEAEGKLASTRRQALSALIGHFVAYAKGYAVREGLERVEGILRTKLRILRAREAAGESLAFERLEAERELDALTLRGARNREAMGLALDGIRELCGDPILPEFVPDSLPWDRLPAVDPPDAESLAARAVMESPEVEGLRLKAEAIREQADLAGAMHPRGTLSFGYTVQADGSNVESGPGVGFHLTIPLGASRISQARQDSLREERSRALFETQARAQSIAAEVRSRYRELLALRASSREAESRARAERERERVLTLQVETEPDSGGRSPLLASMEAQLSREEADIRHSLALMETASAYLRLLVAAGDEDAFRAGIGGSGPARDLDLWVWGWSPKAEDDPRTSAIALSRDVRATGIYLGLTRDERSDLLVRQPDALRAFLARCHRQNLRVELLLAENSWVLPSRRAGFLEAVEGVQRFQKDGLPGERFDGIHLDVEPHALEAWNRSPGSQTNLAEGLLELIRGCRGLGLPVFVDIPAWYERVEFRSANLLSRVLREADGVVVMSYRTDLQRFTEDTRTELELASREGRKVRLGVSVEADLPETEAFRSWETLSRHLGAAALDAERWPAFRGFAVENSADLRRILGPSAESSK